MLAQNFKTAAELDLLPEQYEALKKTLVLLETGKLQYVIPHDDGSDKGSSLFTGHFNMTLWNCVESCGTICCIGGTAELVGNLPYRSLSYQASCMLFRRNAALHDLFFPLVWDSDKNMEAIAPDQAAQALRNYLTLGEPRWPEVLGL